MAFHHHWSPLGPPAGRPLHDLFDLVVGTSTGAILAVGMAVLYYSLDQCEAIYTNLGHKVFNQVSEVGHVHS